MIYFVGSSPTGGSFIIVIYKYTINLLMKKERNGMSESEAGKLGAAKSKITREKRKLKDIEDYGANPKLCPCCNNPIPFEKRKNKFCSQSCAATYTNKLRDKKTIDKQRKTLQNTIIKKLKDQNIPYEIKNGKISTKKIKYCKSCGSPIGECLHPEICAKYKSFKMLSKFGFDMTKVGTTDVYEEYDRTRELIQEEYKNFIDDKTLREKYNYTSGTANFHKILKMLSIKTRTLKEAQKKLFLLGKNTLPTPSKKFKYKNGWHTTWDNKKVFLRSSFEFDYAKLLDDNQINYEVENLRIQYFDSQRNEYRCAIPDFYIVNENKIVEIKSKYTLNILNMKDKFKKYKELGYNTSLILDHKEVNLNELT